MNKKLKVFNEAEFNPDEMQGLLQNDRIKKVIVYALGPEGTNIQQATEKWIEKMQIQEKTAIVLCDTPEQEIISAMSVTDSNTLPIFSLCAVYYNLCNLYFRYPENYFFLSHYYMRLDKLQLASSKYSSLEQLDSQTVLARHRSPAMLLINTDFHVVDADSNAAAAEMCEKGLVSACITTETARVLNNLNRLHIFGSPYMMFTFGTTTYGVELLSKVKGERFSEKRVTNW